MSSRLALLFGNCLKLLKRCFLCFRNFLKPVFFSKIIAQSSGLFFSPRQPQSPIPSAFGSSRLVPHGPLFHTSNKHLPIIK
jgi:hypothetical protein